MSAISKGVIAAGHPLTAQAGAEILRLGGNAFDAVIAAALTACVAEPLLASLAGGGFLTCRDQGGDVRVFDFFGHTPQRQQEHSQVLAIDGDFGDTTQEFHIGMGTSASPGVVDGLWTIQQRLARLPMADLAVTAIEAARSGVALNSFQAHIAQILRPIVSFDESVKCRFFEQGKPLRAGQQQSLPQFADALEMLVREGRDFFYLGEIATGIEQLSVEHGGALRRADLAAYRTVVRQPLVTDLAQARLYMNPPPAFGGMLIAHSLTQLDKAGTSTEAEQALQLAAAMAATDRYRRGSFIEPPVVDRPQASKGTTQISVADASGNLAAMTLSNGEGNGYMIPGTDIQLNNFLGEEDLNPAGIGRWPTNVRIASMMTPTLVEHSRQPQWIALGSGGSNRLRSAILQMLVNHLQQNNSLPEAIERPRLHVEKNTLNIEPGFSTEAIRQLATLGYDTVQWEQKNLFFGGVHAVTWNGEGFVGHGDTRRGGATIVVD